jgi:hypothetical protein
MAQKEENSTSSSLHSWICDYAGHSLLYLFIVCYRRHHSSTYLTHVLDERYPFLYLLCFAFSFYRSWEMASGMYTYSTSRIHRHDTKESLEYTPHAPRKSLLPGSTALLYVLSSNFPLDAEQLTTPLRSNKYCTVRCKRSVFCMKV